MKCENKGFSKSRDAPHYEYNRKIYFNMTNVADWGFYKNYFLNQEKQKGVRMNEVKVNEELHELLKATFLDIEKSIADDVENRRYAHYQGKYFLGEQTGTNQKCFDIIINKNYLSKCNKEENDRSIANAAYKYLALNILYSTHRKTVEVMRGYILLDFTHDFLKNLVHTGFMNSEFYEIDMKFEIQKDDIRIPELIQQGIDMIEENAEEYFRKYKEIMEENEKLKQEYKDYLFEEAEKKIQEEIKEQEKNKRIEKMAEDIESAINAFNKNKQKENQDEK